MSDRDRYNCERCGEVYHEENMLACSRCGMLLCPSCITSAPAPVPTGETEATGAWIYEGSIWLCSLDCEGEGDEDGVPYFMDSDDVTKI